MTNEKEAELATEEASVPDNVPMPDGVLVMKKTSDEGAISTEVTPIGNVQATEVQTLLELGVQGWRKQIGLA